MAKEKTTSLSGLFIVGNGDKHLKVPDCLSGWTDQRLYKRYGLAKDGITVIELKNRPMETNNE